MNAARHTKPDRHDLAPGAAAQGERRPDRRRGRRRPAFPRSCARRSSNRSGRDPTISPHSPGTGIGLSLVGGSPRSTAGARGSRSATAAARRSACSSRPGRPSDARGTPRDPANRRTTRPRPTVTRRQARLDADARPGPQPRKRRLYLPIVVDERQGPPARTYARADARKPPWLKVRLATRPEPRRAHVDHAWPRPPHRLRGGHVPEHRRVLGGARGDVPDPGRPVHAPLRLLRRDDGAARPGRRGRARPHRDGGAARWACGSSS